MHLARLLPVAMLLCSFAAFGQDQGLPTTRSTTNLQTVPQDTAQQTGPSESWRIIPKHELNPEWLQDAAAEYRKLHPEEFATTANTKRWKITRRFLPDSQQATLQLPDHELISGSICLNIRSYVVARDEKDSDSTHPVGSSTCQPASRYHVKSAESTHSSKNP
jgi:hypothetical protein